LATALFGNDNIALYAFTYISIDIWVCKLNKNEAIKSPNYYRIEEILGQKIICYQQEIFKIIYKN